MVAGAGVNEGTLGNWVVVDHPCRESGIACRTACNNFGQAHPDTSELALYYAPPFGGNPVYYRVTMCREFLRAIEPPMTRPERLQSCRILISAWLPGTGGRWLGLVSGAGALNPRPIGWNQCAGDSRLREVAISSARRSAVTGGIPDSPPDRRVDRRSEP